MPPTAPPITIHPDVQSTLGTGGPIVALESTIITHGMPYPANRDTARDVEATVRDHGAVPATIAVLDGELHIGLDAAQIDTLARSTDALKLSRADLAFAIARGVTGSTTVAATMIAAALAGIQVFATGGIGGVHRGAELSFDVSADLTELAQTNVMVVCAGAKAILDIPKTLEMLETLGVPVIAYGQDAWPAFWSVDSGLRAPLRADDPDTLVQFARARTALGIHGGMLVGNPVPLADEIPRDIMNTWIDQAIAEAEAAGVAGKALTPWLLGRIVELSDGRSLATNQSLIRHNAALAARLAVALASH